MDAVIALVVAAAMIAGAMLFVVGMSIGYGIAMGRLRRLGKVRVTGPGSVVTMTLDVDSDQAIAKLDEVRKMVIDFGREAERTADSLERAKAWAHDTGEEP